MDISKKVKSIPRKPGVYLFRDGKGKILYIGKAVVLRDRVRSYFQKSSVQAPRLISLVSRIRDVEWIVTGSEVEALLTEANLIKQHTPKYNVNLKDDKSFPYVQITNEPYPQVLLTRKIVRDGSKYFGPYTDVKTLRHTLKVIHKVFPIRSCNYAINDDIIALKKVSVCLDYHIRKCDGPCEGLVSEQDYSAMIREVVRFLHGKTDRIVASLKDKMAEASRHTQYEEAAGYRDQIEAVERFSKRQRKVSATFDDRDILAIAEEENDACAVVMRLRAGKVTGREKVFLTGVADGNMERTVSDFIRQFYLETDFIPAEIIMPAAVEDESALSEWLKGKRKNKVTLTVPLRGEKARLLRMTRTNAELLLGEYRRRKARRHELIPKMVQQLQSDLNLTVPPRRIEAFDISNIQGYVPVGSMVSFADGKPKKGNYRKFKIKTVKGVDDFAMMREVIYRRYARLKSEKATFPDLIVVDGGKGQLGMATSALQELGLTYIPIVSLAKRLEEVFVPGFSDPQSIPKTSPGLMLLRRIRDEAHRFAVSFHRQRRGKAATKSVFDDIRGVGPVTRKRLLSQFDSVEIIAKASVGELCDSVGVGKDIAGEIIAAAKSFVSQ